MGPESRTPKDLASSQLASTVTSGEPSLFCRAFAENAGFDLEKVTRIQG